MTMMIMMTVMNARQDAASRSPQFSQIAVSSDSHVTSESSSISHGQGGVLEDVDSDDF
jgi:hypothetical protein